MLLKTRTSMCALLRLMRLVEQVSGDRHKAHLLQQCVEAGKLVLRAVVLQGAGQHHDTWLHHAAGHALVGQLAAADQAIHQAAVSWLRYPWHLLHLQDKAAAWQGKRWAFTTCQLGSSRVRKMGSMRCSAGQLRPGQPGGRSTCNGEG